MSTIGSSIASSGASSLHAAGVAGPVTQSAAFSAGLSNIGSGVTSTAGSIGSIFGSLTEISGIKSQAGTQARQQEFGAASSTFNAGLARQEAKLAIAATKLDIRRDRRKQQAFASLQDAMFAKAGVRIDSGTPILVVEDSLFNAELDILIKAFNTDVFAATKDFEAEQDLLEAQIQRDTGDQLKRAGDIKALTTASTAAFKLSNLLS
jgi:hypothetical protein